MQCDLCGSEETLYKTDIEGTLLNVCKKCSKFGKVISAIKIEIKKPKKNKKIEVEPEEKVELVLPDFAGRIRKAREKLGLKQEDFAKIIKEKESVVHKMETGEFRPGLETARKLEKILRIKLVEEYKEEGKAIKSETGALTIGDLIKIRRK